MTDAVENNVDGVEPTTFIKLLEGVNNPAAVNLRSGKRVVAGEVIEVTNSELVELGAFATEVVEPEDTETEEEPKVVKLAPVEKPPVVVSPGTPPNLPGQSG